uniref:hypothetical protein n=1 Tax=Cupriavidus necator TaxID=106590 RepID=UPI003F49A075
MRVQASLPITGLVAFVEPPVLALLGLSIDVGGTPALVRQRGKIRLNVVSSGWVPETLKAMGRDPATGVRAAVPDQLSWTNYGRAIS